jgi:hypothetical protein
MERLIRHFSGIRKNLECSSTTWPSIFSHLHIGNSCLEDYGWEEMELDSAKSFDLSIYFKD